MLTQLGDTPHLDKLIGPVKVIAGCLCRRVKSNAVYLCYTKFINTMKQEPVVEQLLPLSAAQDGSRSASQWPATAGTTSTNPMRKR